MNRPAAGAFGVFGVSHAARGAVLAAALAAPGMAQEPPHDPPIPGADGLGCSTNQANGNVGAGVNVIGEGWVFDYRGQSVLTDRFDHDSRTFSPPDFLYVPTAGDGTGSVFSTGDALLRVDLIDTASKNGYPFDLMLLYRSNRDAAWLEAFGQTGATSATVDLDRDWHLSVVDRVSISGQPGAGSTIRYTSGAGGFYVGQEVAAPPGVSGTFWTMDRSTSILRLHDIQGQSVLDRHRHDGSVMRYEVSPSGDWRPKSFFDPYDNAYVYT